MHRDCCLLSTRIHYFSMQSADTANSRDNDSIFIIIMSSIVIAIDYTACVLRAVEQKTSNISQ